MGYIDKSFSNSNIIAYIHLQQAEVMFGFLFTFITRKLLEHLVAGDFAIS